MSPKQLKFTTYKYLSKYNQNQTTELLSRRTLKLYDFINTLKF